MSYLMGELMPCRRYDRRPRRRARLRVLPPDEDRYVRTKEELIDSMKIALAGRAAEQSSSGASARAPRRPREGDESRVDGLRVRHVRLVTSATMRADNYALSEETKRCATGAGAPDRRRVHRRRPVADEAPRVARSRGRALLQKETLGREEMLELWKGWSRSHMRPRPSVRRRLTGESVLSPVAVVRRFARNARERARALRGIAIVLFGAARPCCAWPTRICRSRKPRFALAYAPALVAARVGVVGSLAPVQAAGSIISAWPSATSTTRSRHTSGSSAQRSSTGRPSTTRASGAASVRIGAGRVELLEPLGEDTPVGRFLAKRGPGMHHVAYESATCVRRWPSSPTPAPT
jgi:hypothetical protein